MSVAYNLSVREFTGELHNAHHEAGQRDTGRAALPEFAPGGAETAERILQCGEDIFCALDASWRFTYVNKAATLVWGRRPQELIGTFFWAVFSHDMSEATRDALAEATRERHPVAFETLSNLRKRWIEGRIYPQEDGGFFLHIHDIHERKQIEAERQASRERYRSLVALLSDWVWELNVCMTYTSVSPQITDCLGYKTEDVIGCTPFDLMTPDEAARVHALVGETVQAHLPLQAVVTKMVRRNGETVYMEVSAIPTFDTEGVWTGYRGVNRDVTLRNLLEEQRKAELVAAVARAELDPLTGLLNRRVFYQRIEAMVTQAKCNDNAPFAVVLMDLDNFKFFNEAYGHLAGDDVLQQVALALRGACGEYDSLARLGGDEFAVLLPGLTRREAIERILLLKEQITDYPAPGGKGVVPLGLSGGAAVFPDDGTTAEALVEMADEYLYRDKASGRELWSTALRDELNQTLTGFSMLDGLVAAVHSKDRYTLRHSEDVLIYAVLIAQELRLSLDEIDTLKISALLHDVGKIGVPDRILRLPGALTVEEYAAVKQHAAMGAAIVSAVPGMEATLPAIRHHHEQWNGSGYPDGLVGEAIPLSARIMAVADAFSAMTTNRPYRVGMTPQAAMQLLRDGAGAQWDKHCVEAFLRAYSS